MKDADRSRSNSSRNSRSQSIDIDYNSASNDNLDFLDGKEDKTFSVTILVNESEKNKIVDMIQKAKTIISKKVEKVIGKKPKSGVTNVEALQTVLESWVGREEQREREDKDEEEKLIKAQVEQVSEMLERGEKAPVSYKPVPEVSVEEPRDEEEEDDIPIFNDMEVNRIGPNRFLQSPTWRPFSPPSLGSLTPTLTLAENVPCPWGNRPESELYPPKLRRPSSHYGVGAAAASSRPASRQVSVSPSFFDGTEDSSVPSSSAETIKPEYILNPTEEQEDETEYEYEEFEEEPKIRYCRPDSFVIPIGGTWKPDEDGGDSEIVWGKVEEAKEETSIPEDKGSRSC